MRPTLIALLVLNQRCTTSSPANTSQPGSPSEQSSLQALRKRWYSVRPLDGTTVHGTFGPWPVLCPGPEQKQPVRYCCKDARSAANLQSVVDQAVAKWARAMLHSTLQIVPDNVKAGALCNDEGGRGDALGIFDATRDGDDAWNHVQSATGSAGTGYEYGSEVAGRHSLSFCNLDPDDVAGTEAKAVRTMMHELGHAIGLQHDHQRPDRNQLFIFHCENLAGYDEAIREAEDDTQGLFGDEETFGNDDDPNVDERMRIVCNNDEAARAYFPTAFSFIRGSDMDLPHYASIFHAYERSKPFDYASIMMCNNFSFDFSPAGTDVNDPAKWVLARKNGSVVQQGGSTDAASAKISPGDVARVAQLYPKPDRGSIEAMDVGNWGVVDGRRLLVQIRGLEIVVDTPGRRMV